MNLNCNTNCIWKNPLLRDGTSQANRFLQALNPDFARIDERDTAEFLRFAYDYATKFKFYNLDNTDSGEDWQTFFRNDTVSSALILKIDLKNARRSFSEVKSTVIDATSNGTRKTRFSNLLKENLKLFVTIQ